MTTNIFKPNTISSNATIAPIDLKNKDKKGAKNEIFVDIIENITVKISQKCLTSSAYSIQQAMSSILQLKVASK